MLTLAQLRRWPLPPLPPDAIAYVVENPSLVAEAATGNWAGPPLICSSGSPTVAVVTLLRQLRANGAVVRQHADFDVGGLSITAWLAARAGTTRWRMTGADYLNAVSRRSDAPPELCAVPDTPWDPPFRHAMKDTGVIVYEEELRADLLPSKVGSTQAATQE